MIKNEEYLHLEHFFYAISVIVFVDNQRDKCKKKKLFHVLTENDRYFPYFASHPGLFDVVKEYHESVEKKMMQGNHQSI